MDQQAFVRVADDDPARCQGITPLGQCRIRAIVNGFCEVHAARGTPKVERQAVKNFRLTQWQARVQEFADSDKVKSLREEIGILRIMLEETLNRCKDGTDLILYSNKISDLVMKVDRVVTSCHKLEEKTGMLLDKAAALHVAATIVGIVSKYVGESKLDEVADEIMLSIVSAS